MYKKLKVPQSRINELKEYGINIDFSLSSHDPKTLEDVVAHVEHLRQTQDRVILAEHPELIKTTEEVIKKDKTKLEEFTKYIFGLQKSGFNQTIGMKGCHSMEYTKPFDPNLMQARCRLKSPVSLISKSISKKTPTENDLRLYTKSNNGLYSIDENAKTINVPISDIGALRGVFYEKEQIDFFIDSLMNNKNIKVLEQEKRNKPKYKAHHLLVLDTNSILREIQLIDTYYDFISTNDGYHRGSELEGTGKYIIETKKAA